MRKILKSFLGFLVLVLFVLVFFQNPKIFASQNELTLNLDSVSYEQPMVKVKVNYSAAETAYLTLLSDNTVLEKQLLDFSKSKDLSFWININQNNSQITAKILSLNEEIIAESPPLVIDKENFIPASPKIYFSKILNSGLININGEVDDKTTGLKIEVNNKYKVRQNLNPLDKFIISATNLHKGIVYAHIKSTNVWGESLPQKYTLLHLGNNKIAATFILVVKSKYTLYYIKDGFLKESFPVAIGTPRTPTIAGFYVIKKKENMPNPNTSWGVLRMLLFQQNGYSYHWSGYAIHGTNNPSSIGKEVSHGCVRMFNEDILKLEKEIPLETVVLILN